MSVRRVFFWTHLVAGVCAGLVILLMSVTGVALTYERQLLTWADSGYRSDAAPGAVRVPLETIVARLQRSMPGLQPSTVIVRSRPDAPVTVGLGARTLYVDAYSGRVVGEASRTGIRAAMSRLREWHRWLGASGEDRVTARAITGWSNLVFLGLVCSGMYLWLPRRWTWQHVRSVATFRGGLRGKARDFNWHNVIGIWSAVPLFLVVLTALPISFPWANEAVYRIVGEEPPPPPRPQAATSRPEQPRAVGVAGLDRAFERAAVQVKDWRSITTRLPASAGGYVLTIDRGDGGQPHLRDTVTISTSGRVVGFESFAGQTLGRRLRLLSRFTHTGEVIGPIGQAVAGVVSAGGAVLVWTGLALAYRRFFKRRAVEDSAPYFVNSPHSSISEP
jgi:uncharacterized iron-regulated membrane protein